MKKIPRIFVCLMIIPLLLQGTAYGQKQNETPPEDNEIEVPFSTSIDLQNHPAERLFQWARDNNIVDGFPDNKMKPDSPVTEAEFLKMLFRAFGLPMPSASFNSDWTKGIYIMAKAYNYPAAGIHETKQRYSPLTMGKATEIIAASQGVHYEGKDALNYAFAKGLLPGAPASIEQFDKGRFLTRTESLSWLRHLTLTGMMALQERPLKPSPRNQLPATPPHNRSFSQFSTVDLTRDDFRLIIGNQMLQMGDKRRVVDEAFGSIYEPGTSDKRIYPAFTVHFNSIDLVDYWYVNELDKETSGLSMKTNKGIELGVSSLFDVLEKYGTEGYRHTNINTADYLYKRMKDGSYRAVPWSQFNFSMKGWEDFYLISFLFDRDTLKVSHIIVSSLPYSLTTFN